MDFTFSMDFLYNLPLLNMDFYGIYIKKTEFLMLNLRLNMECENYKDTSHLSVIYIELHTSNVIVKWKRCVI